MTTNALCGYAITNPLLAMRCANDMTMGVMFPAIIVIVWLIIYVRNSNEASRDAIVGASLVSMILAIGFTVTGIIQNDYVMIVTICLFLGSLAIMVNKPAGG